MGRGIAFFLIILLLGPLALADEYIVIKHAKGRTDRQMPLTGLQASAAEHGLKVVHPYQSIPGMTIEATPEEIEKLKEDPSLSIFPNTRRSLFLQQSVPLIGAPAAHRQQVDGTNLTGTGESICIVDTGIDYDHLAFAGKIVAAYDFVNNDAIAEDDQGHGTHVAGIAAGNSTVYGVGPGADLVIVKVCDATGCWDSDIVAGIDFCNTQAAALDIGVISASLGSEAAYNSTTCSSDPSYALFETVLQESLDAGIIPVFASGNDGNQSGISYPGCSQKVLSVGSTTKADAISAFSNRGERLAIYAPGEGIVSADLNGTTATMSGTSMATPHVAGALAILMQHEHANNRSLNLTQAREILQETGKPVGGTSRIDVDNAVFLLSTGLHLDRSTGRVENHSAGSAVSLNTTVSTGTAAGCITVQENLVGVDSDLCPQYNVSAEITITGLRSAAVPLRNGIPCPTDICTAVNYTNGTLRFNVTGFSNYSALELTPIAINILVPEAAIKGRPLAATINITNNGTEAAQNVTLLLAFAGNVINASHSVRDGRFQVGTVAVNETVLLNLTLNLSTALANGTATSLLTNTTYRTTVETEILISSNASITVIGAPNLTLLITDAPDPATDRATYTLNITNLGDEVAYDAVLMMGLSEGMILTNLTVRGEAMAEDNRSFLLGNISPDQSIIIGFTSDLSSTGPWNLTAQLNYTYGEEEYTRTVVEMTALAVPRRSSGGGGGGGGTPPTKTFFLNKTGDFTLYRGDRIIFKTEESQYSIVLSAINGSEAIFRIGSREAIVGASQSALDVTGDGLEDMHLTLVSITRLSARISATVAAPEAVHAQDTIDTTLNGTTGIERPDEIIDSTPLEISTSATPQEAIPAPITREKRSYWAGILIAATILLGIIGAAPFIRRKN